MQGLQAPAGKGHHTPAFCIVLVHARPHGALLASNWGLFLGRSWQSPETADAKLSLHCGIEEADG